MADKDPRLATTESKKLALIGALNDVCDIARGWGLSEHELAQVLYGKFLVIANRSMGAQSVAEWLDNSAARIDALLNERHADQGKAS